MKTKLLLLGLIASSVVADSREPLAISSFHSLATVQATVTPKATCQGVDGTYTLLSVVGSGPISVRLTSRLRRCPDTGA